MRKDRRRLQDILQAIERIDRYAVQGREVFEEDELIQTWMLYHLQIVGEAASKLSLEFRESYQEIPWAQIIGMRNVLVHDYFGIDLPEVWNTLVDDIPSLKEKIETVLNDLNWDL